MKNCRRGMVVFIRHGILGTAVEVLSEHTFSESVWVSIKLQANDTALVGCIYKSPNTIPENSEQLRDLFCRVL